MAPWNCSFRKISKKGVLLLLISIFAFRFAIITFYSSQEYQQISPANLQPDIRSGLADLTSQRSLTDKNSQRSLRDFNSQRGLTDLNTQRSLTDLNSQRSLTHLQKSDSKQTNRSEFKAIHTTKATDPPTTSNPLYPLKKTQGCCSHFQVFENHKFALLTDVVVDRDFSQGVRGGEDLEDVMNRKEDSEFYNLHPGFFKIFCPEFNKCWNKEKAAKEEIWKHHLNEYFQSIQNFETLNDMEKEVTKVKHTEPKFTIAVTRYESHNLFHTLTDWYNAFYIMKVFNKLPSEIKILLIDGHPKGKMDETWRTLFNSVEIIGHQRQTQTRYKQLVWNIVGYESEFPQKLLKSLPPPPQLQDFTNFFLQSFGISANHKQNLQKLNIFFLWRRDYLATPRQVSYFRATNKTIERKIYNEEELLHAVNKSFPGHNVYGAQLDQIPMKQQLQMIVNVDIIISMHGAGLTHLLFMPSSSGLIELFPQYIPYRPHFEVLAHWRGQSYLHWTNMNNKHEMKNYLTYVPPDIVVNLVRDMIKKLPGK